jgi:hypothetical protein
MTVPSSIILRAGPRARARIAEAGLQAGDISAIPAAAGGPKGLALIPLDKFLFGEWLTAPTATGAPRLLVGSSVGAWRMAAAAQHDATAALERMRLGYFAQNYPKKPSAQFVSKECGRTAAAALGENPQWTADKQLVVVTVRSRGVLRDKGSAPRFAAAVLANAVARRQLNRYFERVLFAPQAEQQAELIRAAVPADSFACQLVDLSAANAYPALLASGTIPMLAAPVRDPAGAPPGLYWDGGMIDYHLDWNWQALPGLVLYPHFTESVVPGWLDKHLPWRKARGAHMDNLLIVSPSPALLARLPRRKLPDRQDFHHFGLDYAARIASWQQAIGECERMVEDFARFIEQPDSAQVLPLL